MTPTRGTPLTTTMGVIDRVHGNTANRWTNTTPASCPGFTKLPRAMLIISNNTDRGAAGYMNFPHFARAQPQLRVVTFTRHQLCRGAGRSRNLPALARAHFNIVHDATHRDLTQRHTVTGPDGCILARKQGVARLDALWRQYIAALAVGIAKQSQVRTAVGVVFDMLNLRWDIDLIAPKINETIVVAVASARMATSHAPMMVAPTSMRLAVHEAFDRPTLMQIGVDYFDNEATSSGCRFSANKSHDFSYPS
jgi:hypothetical protein